MNESQLELKRGQWIIEEARGYIADEDCCVALYNGFEDYAVEMDLSEDDFEDKKEELAYDIGLDKPFFIIDKVDSLDENIISISDVSTHLDLVEYFDDKEIFERNHDSTLIYVDKKKYQAFKNLITEYFSDEFSKSPYSTSAYNSKDIGWGHKPHGSYRVSDHWNFKKDNEIHCKTDIDIEDELAIAKFNEKTNEYEVIFRNYHSVDVIPVKVMKDGIIFLEEA